MAGGGLERPPPARIGPPHRELPFHAGNEVRAGRACLLSERHVYTATGFTHLWSSGAMGAAMVTVATLWATLLGAPALFARLGLARDRR